MESNDISAASAGSTPPIHFLDLKKKKSTALGSVVSKSSNILLVKAPVNFMEEGSHRNTISVSTISLVEYWQCYR